MATRRSKRQSKGVSRVELEETNVNTDSQGDTVIEVKGAAATVAVTWEEKKEEELDDIEKDADAVEEQDVSAAGGVDSMEDTPTESTKSEVQQEEEEPETEETRMEEEEESDDDKKEMDGGGGIKMKKVKGKRKAQTVETSPPKKTKLINDGFCLFVGNLNHSKGFEELKNSLAKYFMSQSLLFQDIRLDRSRKHAHIDLASQMDLTKALTLDGEMMLDKPMKIAIAKVKSEKVKVKVSPEEKKAARDARCLFLKNVPFDSTKEDILKSFHKAVTVRFPGGAEHPDHGIAFVEFKNQTIAEKVLQDKQAVEIQGRVLIVDSIRPKEVSKVTETNDENNTKAKVAPKKILFVSNLSFTAKEKNLKSVFPEAVSIKLPQNKGKSKGFAFVEFSTVEDAAKALQSSNARKICKRAINVQFCEKREKNVESKTLVVKNLAQDTTPETLKSAFEGALTARVILNKETRVSKRFGFVEFETVKESKAAKKAMEHCEIDGSMVTIAYAKDMSEKVSAGGRADSEERPGGQPAGQGAVKAGGKGRNAGSRKKAVKKIKMKD